MIDPPGSIDPLLAQAPRAPSEVLRPLASEQRVLLLDGAEPQMVDLTVGNVRRWENGPPLQVPFVSTPFDLWDYTSIEVQVLRDPRPTSVDLTLLSIEIAGEAFDVVDCLNRTIEIRGRNKTVVAKSAGSNAVVITLKPQPETESLQVVARDAALPGGFELEAAVPSSLAVLTVGGPSTSVTGSYGRRRLIPAHVVVQRRPEPVDPRERAVRLAGRVARAARNRIG